MRISSLFKAKMTADDARVANDARLRFMPGASDRIRLIVLAIIIGLITGAGAALLKTMIGYIVSWVNPLTEGGHPIWIWMWLPVAGIVLTGIYQRYVIHDRISHGVDKLVNDLAERRYILSPKLTFAPIVASSLTLGFGGSAGSEGPIAYTGAAIGSNVGRICGVSPQTLYLLIGCGAGAGIAGIFKAPIGGALFALEVLGMSFTTVSVIALLAACITAAMTAYALSGFTIDIAWTNNVNFEPSILLWTVALGVFCGLYSVYYSVVMKYMRKFYESMKNPWKMNIVSGLVLALTIFLFPSLFSEGYDVIGKIINMDWYSPFAESRIHNFSLGDLELPLVLGGVLLAKCFACSASNSGGGVAGDFAPTLFAGAVAGLFFALVANSLFELQLPPQIFAYIGMAGVMSGVIRAPLMALFLTVEMCNGFNFFLPLVIVTLISFGIVMLVTRRKFYEAHIHLHHSHE